MQREHWHSIQREHLKVNGHVPIAESDYCAADGKEKMPGSNVFLKPYTVTDKKTEVNAQTVVTTSAMNIVYKNQIDLYNKKNFLSHLIKSENNN